MTTLDELTALEDRGEFVRRHVAPSEADIAVMLREVGAESLAGLAARTVPAAIRWPRCVGWTRPARHWTRR